MWVIDLINAVAWPLTLLFAIRWFRDAYIDARMADERDQMRRDREAMVIDRKKLRELEEQALAYAKSAYTTYTYDQGTGYVNKHRVSASERETSSFHDRVEAQRQAIEEAFQNGLRDGIASARKDGAVDALTQNVCEDTREKVG